MAGNIRNEPNGNMDKPCGLFRLTPVSRATRGRMQNKAIENSHLMALARLWRSLCQRDESPFITVFDPTGGTDYDECLAGIIPAHPARPAHLRSS